VLSVTAAGDQRRETGRFVSGSLVPTHSGAFGKFSGRGIPLYVGVLPCCPPLGADGRCKGFKFEAYGGQKQALIAAKKWLSEL